MQKLLMNSLASLAIALLASCGGSSESGVEPLQGQANNEQQPSSMPVIVEPAFTGNYPAETVDIAGLWDNNGYPKKEYIDITENGLWISYSLDVSSIPRETCFQKSTNEIIKEPGRTDENQFIFVDDLDSTDSIAPILHISVQRDGLRYAYNDAETSIDDYYPPAYEIQADDLPTCSEMNSGEDVIPTSSDGIYLGDTVAIAGIWDASKYPVEKYVVITENGLRTTYTRHNNYAETCFRRYDDAIIKKPESENENQYINVDDLNSMATWDHTLNITRQGDSLEYSYNTRQETINYSYPAVLETSLLDLPRCQARF